MRTDTWRRRSFLILLATLLSIASCGGSGGTSEIDPSNANAVTQAIALKLGVDAAIIRDGLPLAQDPQTVDVAPVIATTTSVLEVTKGSTAELVFTSDTNAALFAIFMKVSGADSFFELVLGNGATKAITSTALSLEIPENLGNGSFQLELSAADQDGLISNVATTTVVVGSSANSSGAPFITNRIFTGDFSENSIVDGDFAYVVNHLSGLRIMDVTIPDAPEIIGSVDTTGILQAVESSGNFVYALEHEFDDGAEFHPGQGVVIIEVSNKSDPRIVGRVNEEVLSFGRFSLDNDRIYVRAEPSGAVIYNVEDPTAPRASGFFAEGRNVEFIDISGSVMAVSGFDDGIALFDLQDSDAPMLVAELSDPVGGELRIHGDVVYIESVDTGFRVLDISNLENPRYVRDISTPTSADFFVASQGLLFVALGAGAGGGGLAIYDISISSAPQLVAELRFEGLFRSCCGAASFGVSVNQNFAYVAAGGDGLIVVDFSPLLQ